MIKIFIADDHSIVRSGLKKILKEESDIEIAGEASNYQEVLSMLRTISPDIILLDISMPGRGGLDILKEIKSLYKKIKVLILSMHPEDRFAVRAIRLGAAGYVSKESASQELVDAIRRVYNGNKYISNSLAEKLANSVDDETGKPPHENLSDREFQVLCMIASAKSIKEIAGELSLSPATIASFRGRVLIKLQLKSNVELTSYALRNQLID
jgi:two-component system, NarL family, invasion response regulator UvrY